MLIMEFDLELLSNNFSVTHMILAIPNCLTKTNAVIYMQSCILVLGKALITYAHMIQALWNIKLAQKLLVFFFFLFFFIGYKKREKVIRIQVLGMPLSHKALRVIGTLLIAETMVKTYYATYKLTCPRINFSTLIFFLEMNNKNAFARAVC